MPGLNYLASCAATTENFRMASRRTLATEHPNARARRSRRPQTNAKTEQPRASEKIDAIFRQWQIERPDIDTGSVQIYGLIGQLHLQATAFINEVLAPYDLYRGTFDILTALRRAGAPYALTQKQLLTSLMLSGAGLSSRLDRLEEMRLIARLPEPKDRRKMRIKLTVPGRSLVDKLLPLMFEAQWRRLRPLGEVNQKRLAAELKRLADVMADIDEHSSGKSD
jgi:DNA-binding MarR family transcriptional regulator